MKYATLVTALALLVPAQAAEPKLVTTHLIFKGEHSNGTRIAMPFLTPMLTLNLIEGPGLLEEAFRCDVFNAVRVMLRDGKAEKVMQIRFKCKDSIYSLSGIHFKPVQGNYIGTYSPRN